jgi:hypothetical protein
MSGRRNGDPIAETKCPRCDAELWALALPPVPVFLVRRPSQSAPEFIAALVGPRPGVSAGDVTCFLRNADSLDLVEFLDEIAVAAALLARDVNRIQALSHPLSP